MKEGPDELLEGPGRARAFETPELPENCQSILKRGSWKLAGPGISSLTGKVIHKKVQIAVALNLDS